MVWKIISNRFVGLFLGVSAGAVAATYLLGTDPIPPKATTAELPAPQSAQKPKSYHSPAADAPMVKEVKK